MIVVIRGKKHTFNLDVVGSFSSDKFKSHCESLNIFKQLPIKERNDKIKEAYGNLKTNVKQISKARSGSDIHSNDEQSNGGDTGTEQGSNDGGQNVRGAKDKAKVQGQEIRSEKKEAKH